MKKAIYPGSFDPITNGHLDVIRRAASVFDVLIVAVAYNEDKNPLFSLNERLEMIRNVVNDVPNVQIDSFKGLLVDHCQKNDIKVVIRGLRAISDFEYEFQMTLTNKKLCDSVETIFMMANETYSYLSSRIVKEIVSLGGDASAFVPAYVEKKLKERSAAKKGQNENSPRRGQE